MSEVQRFEALQNEPDWRISVRTVIVRLGFVGGGLLLWFATQSFLGKRPGMGADASTASRVLSEHDLVFRLTGQLNGFLHQHSVAADCLLVTSSLVIDLMGLFLLGSALLGRTMRPFVGLLMIFGLRQVCQVICALPAPDGMIWRSPGFPSLLVTYGVANDFFFSGHTAIAVFGMTEIARYKKWGWRFAGLGLAMFEGAAVLVLRAHYSMDVFAGIVVALLIALLIPRWALVVDRWVTKWSTEGPVKT